MEDLQEKFKILVLALIMVIVTITDMRVVNATPPTNIQCEETTLTFKRNTSENTDITRPPLKIPEKVEEVEEEIEVVEEVVEVVPVAEVVEHQESSAYVREVIFTNYYTGDGSSGDMTASGLNSKNFNVNASGFYTYEGKVVLATANTTRLKRYLFEGYSTHELYEELLIEVNGTTYEAIVLDVCGACYGLERESLQRYDIYTTSNTLGTTRGIVYE